VLLKLDVSDRSKAYLPVSRENVAQFEVRKTLIWRGNSGFGKPYSEPGGRRFESLRARATGFLAEGLLKGQLRSASELVELPTGNNPSSTSARSGDGGCAQGKPTRS